MAWKPARPSGPEVSLSPLQGYVSSKLTDAADVDSLAKATGLPPERLRSVINELVSLGAVVEVGSTTEGVSLADEGEPATEPELMVVADPQGDSDVLNPDIDSAANEAQDEGPTEDVEDEPEASYSTHRQLYEATLHHLPAEERAGKAVGADEPELSALCFDSLPQVVKALLDNPHFGLVHARLVAKHHRHPLGLEAMATKSAFTSDAGVRRHLLTNPILPQALYRRLWSQKRLLDQYKVTVSREVPEQTRRIAREVMRNRFSTAISDERVELIIKTEGRCLTALTGLPVDSKTAAMLCGRTYSSTMLVQNIGRWSAAPPQLIAHLMRQELVRRNPQLRMMLERHPNAPHRV